MNRKKIVSVNSVSVSKKNSVSKRILILILILTLTLTLEDAFADSKGRPDHMSKEIIKTKEVVPVPPDIQVPYSVKRISDGSSIDYHPEFSHDGKQIVFIRKIDNDENMKKGEFWHKTPYSLNLWLMDSDGNNRRQLTSGDVMDFAPRFTPDGKRVIFVSNRRDGRWDIWSIDIDGSNLNRITETEGNTGLWERSHYPFPTPDGKEMIFVIYKKSHGSVWLMDMKSRNIRRITSGGFGDDFPMMSPDGKEIVFKSTRQGNGDVWSIDRTGKNYKRLTYEDYPEFYPAWSPDGTKISYVTNKGGIFDIWIMNRDGKHKKKLTKFLSQGAWGKRFDYNDLVETGYYHVSWHPDGTKLALTIWDPDKKESYLTTLDFGKDIGRVMDSLPDEKETLPDYTLIGEKDITGGGSWDDFGPSFSPDGKTIAFASNRKGNWDIWSISAEGEGLKQMTEDTGSELAPVFSPDGKEIAFLKEIGQDIQDGQEKNINPVNPVNPVKKYYSLWLMNSDGSGARQITEGIKAISYPAWNPDSKEIAFVAKGDKGPEIQLIPLNKGGQEVVTVSRVISIWDTEKPNPSMFPFAKDTKDEEFTPEEMAKMKKLFPNAKVGMGGLTPFTKGETIDVPYPLKEFLYRVDYNAAGDKIIFESNKSGNIDIWSVKKDGTEMTRITKESGPHLNPVFSPDNKRIAYARRKLELSSYNEVNYNIWVADAHTGEEMPINGEEQTDWNPAWSPDGKKIAYVTNRSGEFKHYNIWMLYLK
ncbi:MAG: PD40 domain-containing protein [Nitrospinae bacterium]|nr:PD40 domain-containing protein [Nitrospinota bacterium]